MKKLVQCLVAFVFGLAINAGNCTAQGKQPEKQPEPAKADTAKDPDAPRRQVPPPQELRKVTLGEAKQFFDGGKAVFVDARPGFNFAGRRIKGAVNCSLGEFDSQLNELKAKAQSDTPLVVYCGGETCGLSQKVALKLVEVGFKNVMVFPGGWSTWVQANFPAEP